MAKSHVSKVSTNEQGIRQRGPAKWEVRVFAGRHPDKGKVRHAYRTVEGTFKDAKLVKAKLEVEVGEGKHGVNAEGTFGALLDAWLEDGKQRAPTTING